MRRIGVAEALISIIAVYFLLAGSGAQARLDFLFRD
jgi:hypothetical protein